MAPRFVLHRDPRAHLGEGEEHANASGGAESVADLVLDGDLARGTRAFRFRRFAGWDFFASDPLGHVGEAAAREEPLGVEFFGFFGRRPSLEKRSIVKVIEQGCELII